MSYIDKILTSIYDKPGDFELLEQLQAILYDHKEHVLQVLTNLKGPMHRRIFLFLPYNIFKLDVY